VEGAHAPSMPLQPQEQAAVIAFAERAQAAHARAAQEELANIAAPAVGSGGALGVLRLQGVANWLLQWAFRHRAHETSKRSSPGTRPNGKRIRGVAASLRGDNPRVVRKNPGAWQGCATRTCPRAIAACASSSRLARRRGYSPQVVERLQALMQRGHAVLYRAPRAAVAARVDVLPRRISALGARAARLPAGRRSLLFVVPLVGIVPGRAADLARTVEQRVLAGRNWRSSKRCTTPTIRRARSAATTAPT
jgi:hypothetical protein